MKKRKPKCVDQQIQAAYLRGRKKGYIKGYKKGYDKGYTDGERDNELRHRNSPGYGYDGG